VDAIGLIAGGGRLPGLFAQAAKAQGLHVHAVAHLGETDPALAEAVDSLSWVHVGQAGHVLDALKRQGVTKAVMAGGIGRVRSLTQARADLGALKVLARLRTLRDDELLRAVARWFEENGVEIVSATDYVKSVLVQPGQLAGPPLSESQKRDVELGCTVAARLGEADVGQTVVVKGGVVLAVEAVEGTDEAIRRGGKLGGPGAVVVKRAKPGQDERFDLPAIGPVTLEVMREAGAQVLAFEAKKTIVLDAKLVFDWAARLKIALVAW
jgi:DUF1009 family protein